MPKITDNPDRFGLFLRNHKERLSIIGGQGPTMIGRKLFLQKGDYQTCHIFLPDTQERLAAIKLNQMVFSFFKTVRDREKALDIVGKLYDSGNDAVIVEAPKAYSVWVLEEDAAPVERQVKSSVVTPQPLVSA
jgi:hypothetical protein